MVSEKVIVILIIAAIILSIVSVVVTLSSVSSVSLPELNIKQVAPRPDVDRGHVSIIVDGPGEV